MHLDSTMFDRSGRRDDPAAWTAVSAGGMVATAHYHATDAGAQVLRDGGNAVDAAVAVSLALGVAEPHASGVGGMAMMVIHHAETGRTFAIEGPCRAPALATPEAIGDRSRRRGYGAVAVPGALSALDAALRHFGTMPRNEVVAPAIRRAREGVLVGAGLHARASERRRTLRRDTAAPFFVGPDREPFPVGHLLRQPLLADTIEHLGRAGFRDFYEGDVAAAIERDMVEHGGFIRMTDLAAAPKLEPHATLSAEMDGTVVHSLAPPGGGATVLQMLQIHRRLPQELRDPSTPAGAVALAATIQRARLDRRRFRRALRREQMEAIPFLDDAHLADASAAIAMRTEGGGETSHACIVDGAGNAVSLTQSLERFFGAKVAHPELGFLYNGYLRAFKVRNEAHPHFLRPGVVARSNAAPTIVVDRLGVATVIGSTGAERLPSGILQVLARLSRETPFAAVHAPRLHASPEGIVDVESRTDADVFQALERAGFTVEAAPGYASAMGGLQLITRSEGGTYEGVADPRRDGAAAGP